LLGSPADFMRAQHPTQKPLRPLEEIRRGVWGFGTDYETRPLFSFHLLPFGPRFRGRIGLLIGVSSFSMNPPEFRSLPRNSGNSLTATYH
jgi:hypothetical protein